MTPHPLDRAVWGALVGRQAPLAIGSAGAMRFDPDVSPFVAVDPQLDRPSAALGQLIAAHGTAAFLQADVVTLPPDVMVLRSSAGVQMVAQAVAAPETSAAIQPLGAADHADMLALATLTEPGPFLHRTPLMGDYFGVRVAGRLAAMAGERLKPDGYTEVSAVCTHPEHRGRGLAGQLSRQVASRILARGETPFLHAYATNRGAIALYEALGFRLRTMVTLTVVGPRRGAS